MIWASLMILWFSHLWLLLVLLPSLFFQWLLLLFLLSPQPRGKLMFRYFTTNWEPAEGSRRTCTECATLNGCSTVLEHEEEVNSGNGYMYIVSCSVENRRVFSDLSAFEKWATKFWTCRTAKSILFFQLLKKSPKLHLNHWSLSSPSTCPRWLQLGRLTTRRSQNPRPRSERRSCSDQVIPKRRGWVYPF